MNYGFPRLQRNLFMACRRRQRRKIGPFRVCRSNGGCIRFLNVIASCLPLPIRSGLEHKMNGGIGLNINWAKVSGLLGAMTLLGLLAVLSGGGPAAWQASATSAVYYQYRPVEFSFESTKDYANPFDFGEIDFRAAFTGPNGELLTLPGFWDGGRTWKVRFAPPTPGEWSFATTSSDSTDTGLHNRTGTVDALPAAGSNPLYLHGGILQPSDNNRYLTYQDGTPFFYLADTWWSAPSRRMPIDRPAGSLIPESIDKPYYYAVDKRVEQEYTVLQMHGSKGMFEEDSDGTGFIFTKTDSADDIAYWQEYDKYYDYAAEAGLVINMGVSAHVYMDSTPLDNLQRIFRNVIARYGAYPMMTHITQEYNQQGNLTEAQLEARRGKLFELAAFIRELDPYERIITMHMFPVTSPDPSWDEPWNDMIMDQNGHFHTPRPKDYHFIYNRCDCRPLLESELNYEGFDNGQGFAVDDKVVRNSAYTAIQSGSFGFGYGASGLYSGASLPGDQPSNWGPVPTWWEALDFPGGAQMQHVREAYERVEWWKLEPAHGYIPGNNKVLVKADGYKTFLLWYPDAVSLPENQSLRNTAHSGAVYKATWFNPRTGTALAPSTIAVPGSELVLPAKPDTLDWLLILEYMEPTLPELPDPNVLTAKAWEFATSAEQWTAANHIQGFGWKSGGFIGGTIQGNDPYIFSPDLLHIDTTQFQIVKIRMKNGTDSVNGRLYYYTSDSTGWTFVPFAMVASDAGYTEYTIDLSGEAGWTGVLRRLRIDPGNESPGDAGMMINREFRIDAVSIEACI